LPYTRFGKENLRCLLRRNIDCKFKSRVLFHIFFLSLTKNLQSGGPTRNCQNTDARIGAGTARSVTMREYELGQ
jgi:hypothetical protein